MIQAATSGVKRPWSLRDEADDENQSPTVKDKRLRRENNECLTIKEVGVANLNWPQSLQ